MDQVAEQKGPETTSQSVASPSETQENIETIQVVVFSIDNEEYAVPISDVREIVKTAEITPVPNSPDFVKGIVNLRGEIVVVVDLEIRFHLTRQQKEGEIRQQHIVVVEHDGSVFGLLVDEVSEVAKVPVGSIKDTPSIVSSKIKIDYLQGVTVLNEHIEHEEDAKEQEVKTNERLLMILDVSKILNEQELANLSAQSGGDSPATQGVAKKEKISNNISN